MLKALQPGWLAYLFCQLKMSSDAGTTHTRWHLRIRFDFLDHANSLNSRRILLERATEIGRKERQTDKKTETKIIMDVGLKDCNWKQTDKAC